MLLKVDPLRNLPPGNSQKYSPSAHITSFPKLSNIVLGLNRILLLNKQTAVLHDLANDATIVPLLEQMLHVHIGGEKTQDAIGYDRCQGDQQCPVVLGHVLVTPEIVLGAEGLLVPGRGEDHWLDGVPADVDLY